MDARQGRHAPASVALGVVIAAACVAAVGSIGGSFFLFLEHGAATAEARAACNICGVVTAVREARLAPPQAGSVPGGVNAQGAALRGGGSLEGVLVLLASFGRVASGEALAPEVYEVTVRFPDGSERVLRQAQPPRWKAGDRVKVIMGRIEAIS